MALCSFLKPKPSSGPDKAHSLPKAIWHPGLFGHTLLGFGKLRMDTPLEERMERLGKTVSFSPNMWVL